jgi:Flp pilus assembly protein TadG
VNRIDLRREGGVAMAEFALIVPVFLLMLIGIISFGRVYFAWNDANHLANETARWAAVDQNPYAPVGANPPGTGGRTLQQHVLDNGFSASNVCITYQNASPAVGDYLTVRVQKPLTLKIKLPLIPSLDIGFTIRGTSTQRIENLEGSTYATAYSTANDPNVGNIGTCP